MNYFSLSLQDIAILNFFMDTPIITEITLEVRTNVYGMISAIGGTLGLFTGISVITFAEVIYWICKFLEVCFKMMLIKYESLKRIYGDQQSAENGRLDQHGIAEQNGLTEKDRKNSAVKSSFL